MIRLRPWGTSCRKAKVPAFVASGILRLEVSSESKRKTKTSACAYPRSWSRLSKDGLVLVVVRFIGAEAKEELALGGLERMLGDTMSVLWKGNWMRLAKPENGRGQLPGEGVDDSAPRHRTHAYSTSVRKVG